jgi:hypothetical protein
MSWWLLFDNIEDVVGGDHAAQSLKVIDHRLR